MMKKLAGLAGAGAMLLAMTAPALGWWWNDDDVSIRNRSFLMNDVTTKSDSGDNSIHGKYVFGGDINTGDAGAASELLNDVNSSQVGDLGGDVRVKNKSFLMNDVYTKADTGDNSIHGKVVGGGDIDTGDAGAASVVVNSVNYTAVGL